MTDRTEIDSSRDPGSLEQDIDRTRASLGRTVDELEQRLSPGQLLDQAMGMAREHGGEFATNLGRSVKNNPVPMLLTGVGLAWMMASSNEPRASAGDGTARARGAGESVRDRARAAGASVSGGAHQAGEKSRQARESISGAVGTAGDRFRSGTDRARSSLEYMLDEQPLVIGAMGVALGAALGAAFPRTEAENRMLGETRDSLAEQAKQKAAQTYDEARDRAGEAAAAVEESQRERSGDTQWETPRGTEH